MKKKIISTLLCTAMLATMVAGCGVEKSDGGSDTESSASSVAEMKGTGDNEINILIYAQDHEKAVYQELIDKFTKEHAEVDLRGFLFLKEIILTNIKIVES